MSHPGPPRFATVDDRIELAPRDPDPSGSYEWHLARRPSDSGATLGDDPVEHLHPDAPGTYRAVLDAPDGEHRLTVRAFPLDVAAPVGSADRGSGAYAPDEQFVGRGQPGDATPAVGPGAGARPYGPWERGGGGDGDEGDGDGDGGGRPRIRLDGRVEDGMLAVEATLRPTPRGDETAADLEAVFLVDDRDRDDVPMDAVTVEGATLRLPLSAVPDRLRVHAVAVGEGGCSVPDMVDCTRAVDPGGDTAVASITVDRPYDPPPWARDMTVYEIYVRSFAGDEDTPPFEAIEDRLDYLADLGFDTLWLTPVLENDHAPHGYNIRGFFSIADDLGTREDYERLIEAAHERDIAVLFDLVFNHSARTHPYFEAAVEDPDSEYYDWYEWQAPGVPGTYFDWEHIANFSFGELAVRRHLLDVVDEWAPLVDGFRCDMAWAVPDGFWREVHDRVKAHDPDFLLLDETIPYIPDFQAGLFDVHFDSTTAFTLREVGVGNQPAPALLDAIDERTRVGFPDHAGFMLYAENHDEGRYVTVCGREPAFAAAGALATLPGAPMVYAGGEFGQLGRRDDLVWNAADEHLRTHYRSLLGLRNRVPALQTAATLDGVDYEVTDGDAARVVAYARRAPDAGGHVAATDENNDVAADEGRDGANDGSDGSPEEAEAVAVVLNFGDDRATVSLGPAVDSPLYLDGSRDADPDGGEPATEGTRVVVDSVAVVRLADPD